MSVKVWQKEREEKDPLDKLVKIAGIGVGIGGLASKAGGSAPEVDAESVTDNAKPAFEAEAENPKDYSNVASNDSPMKRRLGLLKYGYGIA